MSAKYDRIQDLIAKTIGIAAVASLSIVPAAAAQQPADDAQPSQAAPPAQSQPASPAQAAQPQSDDVVTSAAVSDEEVESFTKAYMEIRKVQDEAKAGGDNAEAKQQATEKMNEVITDHDLTVARYNQIARSLSQDQTLMQRIQQKMAELQAGDGADAARPGAETGAQAEENERAE